MHTLQPTLKGMVQLVIPVADGVFLYFIRESAVQKQTESYEPEWTAPCQWEEQ